APQVTGEPAPTITAVGALPGWLQLDSAGGILFGTPAAGDVGQHTITLQADNGAGVQQQTFTINVDPPPGAPALAETFTVTPPAGWVATGDWEFGVFTNVGPAPWDGPGAAT